MKHYWKICILKVSKPNILRFQNEFSPDKRSMQKSGGGASAEAGLHDPANSVWGETAVGTAGMGHARMDQKSKNFVKNFENFIKNLTQIR